MFSSVRRYLNTRVQYENKIEKTIHPGHGYLIPYKIVSV